VRGLAILDLPQRRQEVGATFRDHDDRRVDHTADEDRWQRTPYVIGKIVSRLEMDSRWALARSVRALVAERDRLKEKMEKC
jgi:hypothetical protein